MKSDMALDALGAASALLAAACAHESSVGAAVLWFTGGVCLAKAFGVARREDRP